MAQSSPSNSPAEPHPRVLLVDDDPAFCEFLALELKTHGPAGLEIEAFTRLEAASARLDEAWRSFHLVITDLNLGRSGSGLALVRQVAQAQWPLPVIVLTGFGTVDAAVVAIRAGAYDFLTKPFEPDVLRLAVDRAIELAGLKRELQRLRLEVTPRRAGLWGDSPVMEKVRSFIERVGRTASTVLITGESGTGKELVARGIHEASPRASGPLVAVNCGAVPEMLLDSELFGHVKGAFTDARTDRLGVVREAHGGTLFLDEIGELPLSLQPKLLRVLQERTVRPVGGQREVSVDVRIIAATNVDLEAAVETGKFREDLFYRLDVLNVEVPPLRTRGRDVLVLAQRFLEGGTPRRSLSPEAAAMLMRYEWPGNVRELQNAVERAQVLASHEVLIPSDFPERMRSSSPVPVPDSTDASTLLPLVEVERRYVLSVLNQVQGNKRRAAQVLGLDRSTLYRRLKDFGVSE